MFFLQIPDFQNISGFLSNFVIFKIPESKFPLDNVCVQYVDWGSKPPPHHQKLPCNSLRPQLEVGTEEMWIEMLWNKGIGCAPLEKWNGSQIL